jgi:hypothetical protein
LRNVNRTVVSAVLGSALAAGLLVAGATPAAAATCPSGASPVVKGAKASWTLKCSGGTLAVYGWLEDTKRDGRCAKVTIVSAGQFKPRKACGKGERVNFDYKFKNTKKATVKLSTTNVTS